MNEDEIIELAIQGHASIRDAIKWALKQEREKILAVLRRKPDQQIYKVLDEIRGMK